MIIIDGIKVLLIFIICCEISLIVLFAFTGGIIDLVDFFKKK